MSAPRHPYCKLPDNTAFHVELKKYLHCTVSAENPLFPRGRQHVYSVQGKSHDAVFFYYWDCPGPGLGLLVVLGPFRESNCAALDFS